MSSHLIEKNGEGILGFITNHGYLDNPTFRGMRWHLLKSFDKIYVLDLHGNAKKKEVTPEGKPDKNVFDIQQGVAIIIAVKTKYNNIHNQELAIVKHGELWGKREEKNALLIKETLSSNFFQTIETPDPQYPFVKRDFSKLKKYVLNNGVQLNEYCLGTVATYKPAPVAASQKRGCTTLAAGLKLPFCYLRVNDL